MGNVKKNHITSPPLSNNLLVNRFPKKVFEFTAMKKITFPCINCTNPAKTTRCACLKLIFKLMQLNPICLLDCLNQLCLEIHNNSIKKFKKNTHTIGSCPLGMQVMPVDLCNTSETRWISWPERSRGVKQLSPLSPGVRLAGWAAHAQPDCRGRVIG